MPVSPALNNHTLCGYTLGGPGVRAVALPYDWPKVFGKLPKGCLHMQTTEWASESNFLKEGEYY